MSAGNFPIIKCYQWDVAEIASPAGQRHIPGGSFAFQKVLSSGCSAFNPNHPESTSGILIFEDVKFDLTSSLPSHVASKPTVITFHLQASGTAISDMRLFLVNDSAFQGSSDRGLDRAFIQYAPSGSLWQFNLTLPSGSVARLPLTMPIRQNVFRQDKGHALVGEDDPNSSEFIYLNMILPLGSPFGTFGVCGSGLLRLGLVFSYWNNSHILQFGDIG